MVGTSSAVGTVSSACLPLSLGADGLHSFQELLPVLLVKWGWKTLSSAGGAVVSFLPWAWANQPLGSAELV